MIALKVSAGASCTRVRQASETNMLQPIDTDANTCFNFLHLCVCAMERESAIGPLELATNSALETIAWHNCVGAHSRFSARKRFEHNLTKCRPSTPRLMTDNLLLIIRGLVVADAYRIQFCRAIAGNEIRLSICFSIVRAAASENWIVCRNFRFLNGKVKFVLDWDGVFIDDFQSFEN